MALFKKKRTIRRCRTMAKYVSGIDDAMVERMMDFLLQDKHNTVQASREYLMFVDAAGAMVFAQAIVPLREDFNAIAISSSWARVQAPYSSTGDAGSTTSDFSTHHDDEDKDEGDGGAWSEFSDSDGSDFTNNNNNNNNNNNG